MKVNFYKIVDTSKTQPIIWQGLNYDCCYRIFNEYIRRIEDVSDLAYVNVLTECIEEKDLDDGI